PTGAFVVGLDLPLGWGRRVVALVGAEVGGALSAVHARWGDDPAAARALVAPVGPRLRATRPVFALRLLEELLELAPSSRRRDEVAALQAFLQRLDLGPV